MNQKDQLLLVQKVIIFLLLFFVLFILFVNLIKIIAYVSKVDNVLKAMQGEDKINVINSEFNNVPLNDTKGMNVNHAHIAEDMGYVNALYTINGSEWGDGINILLIASDKKSYKDGKARSDVIIVLRIINKGKILSISIPRDTLIMLRDGKWAGYKDKIGHSFYWGGIENLKKDIEILLGSPICNVAIIDNFKNFEAFLAIIGGLKTDKKLYGKLGIQWIRNRNFQDGDIGRCKRHQLFIKKAMIKIWNISKKGNHIYSVFLFNILKTIVNTDLSKKDFLNMLYNLKKNNFDPEADFLTSVLPGKFGKYNSVLLQRNRLDCWIVNEDIVKKMQFLFYSEDNNGQIFAKRKFRFLNFF